MMRCYYIGATFISTFLQLLSSDSCAFEDNKGSKYVMVPNVMERTILQQSVISSPEHGHHQYLEESECRLQYDCR